ncbi:pyridoxal phosphate-dependent decarboxylase family protein [Kineobactrum salinum]|uniref:Amino acid decarboxylase n=1 Tax=Kineobactrum salinum TaxID=2708301 RepID=A0A6C0TYI6_9GAMM|nr:pyridoxal-dependent decarboxylase [Kineobactrum salinum]QIB64708.1 amino acid decarboxylase [Kineobactrum salinum]
MPSHEEGLDPDNWQSFAKAVHDLLDECIHRLQCVEDYPWRPVPEDIHQRYLIGESPLDMNELVAALKTDVMPYATGNTHPRFFGWVHGTGLATGLLTEMASAAMNSNCGGRDHGMTYMEREVIDWTKSAMGFPAGASGVLVAGTSQATVIALAAARVRALGPEVRVSGQAGQWLTAYTGPGTHSAIRKAVELLGIGSENLRIIPENERGMDPHLLRKEIARDRAAGAMPFAIIATAGSVDLGKFDDLKELASVAAEEDVWLHVDGAFGAWTRLAEEPWRGLSDGIELADSLACDFHKWMFVQYDCGLVLIRDEHEHRQAFSMRPSYLTSYDQGLAGGEPWYCDYGIDLSRGNRALKVWAALRSYGPQKLGQAITRCCQLAQYMAELIAEDGAMQLQAPVVSSLCVFTADGRLGGAEQSEMNVAIAQRLQIEGAAVFSTTNINNVTYLRAAITNHRTRRADVARALHAVVAARDRQL